MSRVAPISAVAATALAVASGVPCAIIQWITLDTRSARVALETTDPDPTITLSVDTRAQPWLGSREESAPDRWDYHAALRSGRAMTGLRFGRAPNFTEIPFLPAELALLSAYGWGEHLERPADALLDGAAVRAAIEAHLQLHPDL